MKKVIMMLAALAATAIALHAADENTFYLTGHVKDAITNAELTDARVIVYDSLGAVTDTVRCNVTRSYRNGEEEISSYFFIKVPRSAKMARFDVECDGYMTETIDYEIPNVGKRETYRRMPNVMMRRAPRQLGEVTVTASKIKFYNRGDTIVYNADAFNLAEGSMLDALIAQMPGTELNDEGQIKVNGEFVEELLLDGKQFFDGNNQLMLENIAAYTVKSVEVYKGQNKEDKWAGDPSSAKHLTMDVRLKKEYNMGWLVNLQGGYGTDDRYMGRAFVSWFNPTARLTLVGNVNNLNDNRKPGKSDTWTPEMMPSGTKEYKMGGLNYNVETRDEHMAVEGQLTFDQTVNRNLTTTARTNFLQGGDTWDYSWNNGYNRLSQLTTKHNARYQNDNVYTYIDLDARYKDRKNNSHAVGATFDTEQEDVTMAAIEALYSDGTPARLASVINRSITRSDASSHDIDLRATPTAMWKIPGTTDRLMAQVYIRYFRHVDELWKDYEINYGDNPVAAVSRRQYFDNTPNHSLTTITSLGYNARFGAWHMGLDYDYRFYDLTKDSYMYALDRLADIGVYGTLPAGWLSTLDPANSYSSRLIENTHTFNPSISYYKKHGGAYVDFTTRPDLKLKHSHLDYWREGRRYDVRRSDFFVAMESGWNTRLILKWGQKGEGRDSYMLHNLRYEFESNPTTPDVMDMVTVVNDSDPLNITEGNPDLKTQYLIANTLRYEYYSEPRGHILSNKVSLRHENTSNALTRGYTYDTATGVRHIRTYNVDGNTSTSIDNSLRLLFGRKNQFTLTSATSWSTNRYADMIGTNVAVPSPTRVRTNLVCENLRLTWQIGAQTITLRGDLTNRHTTSSQAGFATIDARHFSYGISGVFKLPAGLGISTDFTVYTRRGYGVKQLDTSDAIWNMRLTYNPAKARRWVFMLDGFDMLRQLSNVNYAVNAAGRTVTYTNALPRYVLLSAQYRLNIQPKKR